MKRLLLDLAVLTGGVVAVIVFYLFLLPGAPSQYGPKFPVEDSLPPQPLWHTTSDHRVGYDVYDNVKGRPLIAARVTLPTQKITTWVESGDQNGIYHMRQALWMEAHGILYKIASAEKNFTLAPNKRFFTQTNTLLINPGRKFYLVIEAPELNIRETFGPYDLP
jgi:hypothetical protein